MQVGWLLTNVLMAIGLGVGWYNPVLGLMVYYAFAILRPTDLWFWNVWPTERLSLYVALSTLIGWAINGLGHGAGTRGIKLPLLGLAAYLLSGTIAWRVQALDQDLAWRFLSIQLKIGLMALVTVTLLVDRRTIFMFAYLITGSLGYLAWVFNSQYYFDKWNRIWPNGFGGIDNNGVAMIMVMGVPLAFFVAINTANRWIKGLCFFAVALMVHAVLFSFSRGGQLGLVMVGAAIFIVALVKLPRRGLTLLAGAAFVAFAIHFAGREVRMRFWTTFADPAERDASAQSRFETWSAALRCMRDNPLGVGPRNFNLVATRYGLGANKSVHNLFLQTGADYGILGMVGLALFYVGGMYLTFRMTNTAVARRLVWPRYFGHMVCVSLTGFLVCSTFIGMESVETAYMITLLGLCTVSHVLRQESVGLTEEAVPELAQVPRTHGDGESGEVVAA
jgi:O-antigen ligase